MLRSVLRNKKLFIGLIMLAIFLFVGLAAPLLTPYPYDQSSVGPSLQGPSREHSVGTIGWAATCPAASSTAPACR